MREPLTTTFQTFNRLAEDTLTRQAIALDLRRDYATVEQFVMRTGRPLPRMIVAGEELALRCAQIDELGGDATGVDPGQYVIALSKRRYPEGTFQCAPLREFAVESSSFDGVWSGQLLARVPRQSVVHVMRPFHYALRPGGLLFVRVTQGDGERFEETTHGPVYRVNWQPDELEQTLGELDFDLLETQDLPDGEFSMILRREY